MERHHNVSCPPDKPPQRDVPFSAMSNLLDNAEEVRRALFWLRQQGSITWTFVLYCYCRLHAEYGNLSSTLQMFLRMGEHVEVLICSWSELRQYPAAGLGFACSLVA